MHTQKFWRRFLSGLLVALPALLAGCSQPAPPNDQQALKMITQLVEEQGGQFEVHESLGRARSYRPLKLLAVRTKKCVLIARNAFWCEFWIDFATEEKPRETSPIAVRVEVRRGQYRAMDF